MLIMMKKYRKENPGWRRVDPFLLSFIKTIMRSLARAIAARIRVWLQDLSACEEKRSMSLGAYILRGMMLLSYPDSSTNTNKGSVLFRMESIV